MKTKISRFQKSPKGSVLHEIHLDCRAIVIHYKLELAMCNFTRHPMSLWGLDILAQDMCTLPGGRAQWR